MLVKMYKSYIPTVSEVYHQIGSIVILSQICDIATKYGLDSLVGVTKQEMDWRKDPKTQYTIDKVSMCKILQKNPDKIAALEELFACAAEYHLNLLALCTQTALVSLGHRDTARKLFKKEFEKDVAFIFSEFGRELLVNLYRNSSDSLLGVENCAFRRFFAEQA